MKNDSPTPPTPKVLAILKVGGKRTLFTKSTKITQAAGGLRVVSTR